MNKPSTSRTLPSLLLVLTLTVSGCASTAVPSVVALPQPAKPQVPSSLMEPEWPRPSTSLQRLSAAFETSLKKTTGK